MTDLTNKSDPLEILAENQSLPAYYNEFTSNLRTILGCNQETADIAFRIAYSFVRCFEEGVLFNKDGLFLDNQHEKIRFFEANLSDAPVYWVFSETIDDSLTCMVETFARKKEDLENVRPKKHSTVCVIRPNSLNSCFKLDYDSHKKLAIYTNLQASGVDVNHQPEAWIPLAESSLFNVLLSTLSERLFERTNISKQLANTLCKMMLSCELKTRNTELHTLYLETSRRNALRNPFRDQFIITLQKEFNLKDAKLESLDRVYQIGNELIEHLSAGVVFLFSGLRFTGDPSAIFSTFGYKKPIEIINLERLSYLDQFDSIKNFVEIAKLEAASKAGFQRVMICLPGFFDKSFGISMHRRETILKTHLYGSLDDANTLYSSGIWKSFKMAGSKELFTRFALGLFKESDISYGPDIAEYLVRYFLIKECIKRDLKAK